MPLTDIQIRQLRADDRARLEVWDRRVPGFGVRVSGSGHKSFVLLYRHKGRSRRMTIGRYPIVGLAEARRRALEVLGQLAKGVDPSIRGENSMVGECFGDAVEYFIRNHCTQHNRISTRRETERILRVRFVNRWGNRPLREIAKSDVIEIIDEVIAKGAPSAANHALATARVFFNWCADRGLIDLNPCARVKMPAKKVSRERVLNSEELVRIWLGSCTLGYPFGTITQLLLLTAQRRNEIAQLRWGHLDFEEG
ncbi:MAG: tyrosine-type recombinase/integrase, partial [Hyphomicrobiaceae bacterium]